MYCDRRGNGQKPIRTKPPVQKPPRTIEIEFVQGTFVQDFVLGLLKIGGFPRCVTYFRGVPGCVTKCDGGGGSKLAKNSVTYFMDGPIASSSSAFPLGSASLALLYSGSIPTYPLDSIGTFSVKACSHSSRPLTLSCGVPQGSVLLPLFILYTTPLSHLIKFSSVDHHLYADDIQLFISFSQHLFPPQSRSFSLWSTKSLNGCHPTSFVSTLPKQNSS